MAYTVVGNKSRSHLNILYDVKSKSRIFTNTSLLYRCLASNIDVVDSITQLVVKSQNLDIIKDIQHIGREENKKLKKIAFQVFDVLGWDQHQFDIGFDFIKETSYERIPEDIKTSYTCIIEEAFFTMTSRKDFYSFLRNFTEGSIKSKQHMSELLKDILVGININEQINDYMNETYGSPDESDD